MKLKEILLYAIIAVLIVASGYFILQNNTKASELDRANRYINDLRIISAVGTIQSAHLHAGFATYINNKKIGLSQQKYQVRAQHVHVEDGIGEVIHIHAKGIRLGHFLSSIGFKLTGDCITTDTENFCTEGKSSLKFYINGKRNNDFESYEIKDMDKILISYGSESDAELKKQIDSVTLN